MPSATTPTASPTTPSTNSTKKKRPHKPKTPIVTRQAAIALGSAPKSRWLPPGGGGGGDHDSDASDVESVVSSVASGNGGGGGKKGKASKRRKRQVNGVAREEIESDDEQMEVAPVSATTVDLSEERMMQGDGKGETKVFGVAIAVRQLPQQQQGKVVAKEKDRAAANVKGKGDDSTSGRVDIASPTPAPPSSTSKQPITNVKTKTKADQLQWRRTSSSPAPSPSTSSSVLPPPSRLESDRRPYSPHSHQHPSGGPKRRRPDLRPWTHDGYAELESPSSSSLSHKLPHQSAAAARMERYVPRFTEPPWTARSPVPYLFNEGNSRAYVDIHTGDLVKGLRIRLPATKAKRSKVGRGRTGYLVATIMFRRPAGTGPLAALLAEAEEEEGEAVARAAWKDKIIRVCLPLSKTAGSGVGVGGARGKEARQARGRGANVRYEDVLAEKGKKDREREVKVAELQDAATQEEEDSKEETVATSLPEEVQHAALAALHVQAQSGGQEHVGVGVVQPAEVFSHLPPPPPSVAATAAAMDGPGPSTSYQHPQYLPQSYHPVLQPAYYPAPVYYVPPPPPHLPQLSMHDPYEAQYASYSPSYLPTPPPTQYFFVPARAKAGIEIRAPPPPSAGSDSPGPGPSHARAHRHHRHLSTVTQSAAKATPFVPGHTVLPPTPAFTPPPETMHQHQHQPHPEAYMHAQAQTQPEFGSYYYAPQQAYATYPMQPQWAPQLQMQPQLRQMWYEGYPTVGQHVFVDAQTEDPAIISIQ